VSIMSKGPEILVTGGEDIPEEYKNNPNSPELLTQFMRVFWQEAGQRIGKSYVVDEFPLTAEDLGERQKEDRMAIFVPHDVSRHDLVEIFPKMGSGATQQGLSIDNEAGAGWLWIESSDYNLRKYLNSEEISKGFLGQSLRTYIIGSQIRKLLTRRYFDQAGSDVSQLTGHSPWEFRTLLAKFSYDGRLSVWDRSEWSCRGASSDLEISGYRTEQLIKPPSVA